MSTSPVADIELRDVRAGYDQPVVGPISLRIERGRIVALWGPNGSGKTTLLNTISGGARVFEGAVLRRPGLRVSHQHQNALPISGIPLSGRELMVLTGADPAAVPAAVVPLLRRRLSDLSGGQLQLLQVLACLLAPVDLVLLDEPTNNVDGQGVAYLERALTEARPARTVLLVSHDRRFVEAVSDQIIELESAETVPPRAEVTAP